MSNANPVQLNIIVQCGAPACNAEDLRAIEKRWEELHQLAQRLQARTLALDHREHQMEEHFRTLDHQIRTKQKNLDDDKAYLISRERSLENREIVLLDNESTHSEDNVLRRRVSNAMSSSLRNVIIPDDPRFLPHSQSHSQLSSTVAISPQLSHSHLSPRQHSNSSPNSLSRYPHCIQSPHSPHSPYSFQQRSPVSVDSVSRRPLLNRHYSEASIHRSQTPTPQQLLHQRYYRTSEHNPLANQLTRSNNSTILHNN